MGNKKQTRCRETVPLPREVTCHYEGKYLVYSEEEGRVIGVGETEEEAFEQARASGVHGEWHLGYAFRADEQIF